MSIAIVRKVRTVNEIVEDVAETYVPSLAIATCSVHAPGPTKVTTPVEALIVHTDAVVLEYVLVPDPAEAVLVKFGGVALLL